MPTALVINPNTTQSMTDDIGASAAKVFKAPWDFHAVQPPGGTPSIESTFEGELAAIAMLAVLKEYPAIDGVVIACFGEHGLFGLREILPVPVVGIAEASFLTACMVGAKYGVMVGGENDAACIENLIWMYGLEKRHAGSEVMEMEVLEMNVDFDKTLQTLADGAGNLLKMGAEVILLGCAGLVPYQAALQEKLGVPVIDPVEAGCQQLRSLVEMGLTTSRSGMFMGPNPKTLTNLASFLEPGLAEWLGKKSERGFTSPEE